MRGTTRIGGALCALLLATACGGENIVLPEDGVPFRIEILGGNGQNGTAGQPLDDSIAIRVFDAQNRALPDQQINFTILTGGGTLAPATVETDPTGRAATRWTLGAAAGPQQAQAKVVGNGAPADLLVLLNASAGAAAAANLSMISGNDQVATAGSALDDSLIVKTTDGAGNPVAGVAITWTITGGGSVSEGTTVTGTDGRTGVKRTLGPAAGPQTTIASAAGLDGSPVTFAATATVGSAGRLVITQQPSLTAASGAVFAIQPRVQVQDVNGNDVTTSGRAVTAEIAGGPGGSTLVGSLTRSTVSGVATWTNLAITGPAGDYTLNFTSTDLTGATSNTITLTAGAPAQLAFSVQPSNATAGEPISPAVRVTIQDALGQTVTSASNAVTINLGSNPGGGTLSGDRTENAVNGIATFSTLEIDRTGNGYTLAAVATGLTGASSIAFNVSTGPAASIAANSTVPANTVAGGTVSPDPSVKVTDASGNPVSGQLVTFATVGGGSVSGETQTTNAQGIATVGSWTIGGSAGVEYQLTASAPGLSGSPVTFSTTATAGSAGKIEIVTQPAGTAQSGVALNPQPSVRLLDNSDNPVSTSGIAITAEIASGPGGATLTNFTASTVSGVATFSGLRINGPSGTYTLSFTNPTLSADVSDPIVLGSGAASRIAMVTQPSATVQNGQEFPQQPSVQLVDGSGNPVGESGRVITVSLQPASGASLGGDLTQATNSEGIATFTDLRITGNLTTRTLLFAATGLTAVSSEAIIVTPGPVSASLSTLTASPGSFTAGTDPGSTVTVTAKDQSGNLIPDAVVDPASTGNGAFTPATAVTDANGQAEFAYTNTEAGNKTISATVGGVLITQTASVTVNPGPPSAGQSSISAESPRTAGQASLISITVRDQFSNPIEGSVVVLTPTNGGTVTDPAATDASGQTTGTFTATEPGNYSISVTADGVILGDAIVEVTP